MYGEGAFGETAFGESPGEGFVLIVGVSGSMGAIEAKDIFAAVGNTPLVSVSAIADQNMLIVVVEIELGQFV